MSRRYNTAKSKTSRELLIKRFNKKGFIVEERGKTLFTSLDFGLCVEFRKAELNTDYPEYFNDIHPKAKGI